MPPTIPFTAYLDDVAVSPYAWLGPAPVPPFANVTITV
jgi:hypothetical protein